MKIYYIANVNLNSGKANVIQLVKMCEAFSREGIYLTLIVPFIGERTNLESLYKLRNKFAILRLPVFSIFPKTSIGFNLRAVSFLIVSTVFVFLKKLFGEKFILYTIDLDQFSYFLLPRIAPTTIEMHGSKTPNIFLNSFFKKVTRVVAVSNSVKESLARTFNIPSVKITVCPNGIDLDFFNLNISKTVARKKLGLPDGSIFLYSGKFYDWKGLDTLVKAMIFIKDIKVYLVGGTIEDLKNATGALEIPENIICLGNKPFALMPMYLISADYFLLTGTKGNQYSFYETSPMKLFEYMALGKPVIACETPAVREVVDESEVLFYKPDDAGDLSEKIRYATFNRDDMLERARKLKMKASLYSIDSRAKKILRVIGD